MRTEQEIAALMAALTKDRPSDREYTVLRTLDWVLGQLPTEQLVPFAKQALPGEAAEALPPLSPRQQEILDLVAQSVRERGYPPTYVEVCAELGFASTNTVGDHFKALTKKGYLVRDGHGQARALRLTPAAQAQQGRRP